MAVFNTADFLNDPARTIFLPWSVRGRLFCFSPLEPDVNTEGNQANDQQSWNPLQNCVCANRRFCVSHGFRSSQVSREGALTLPLSELSMNPLSLRSYA